jgi:hypothetical protein
MDKSKVKRWLEKHLWDTRDEGPVVKIVVKHLDANGRAGKEEIWSCNVPHEEDSVTLPEEDVADLINEIDISCYDDAEGMAAGLQRYKILCYVKHKTHPHSRFTFSLAGDSADVDDTGVSEPATEKGLQAQTMRHLEAVMRTSVMSTNQNMAMMQRTIGRQNEHIEKLLEDRRATFEITEDLKSQHHERELATRQAESQDRRYSEMFEKASLLLPAVVNRVAGKKLLPESVSPMQDMLKGLAESLTEEQLTKIMPSLKPEQQIVLLEFMDMSQGEEKPLQLVKTNTSK